MCRVLSVSKSGFYEWLSRKKSSRSIAYAKDSKEIISIYNTSKKRYGSYKIHAELSFKGIKTSRNRVARIMKSQGIKSIVNKKYRVQTTDSNHSNRISKNLLKRNFYPQSSSQAWVSDIT
ncbi:IS3 family transposase, partial [Ancylomarina longa]